jgi:hypothetical protein
MLSLRFQATEGYLIAAQNRRRLTALVTQRCDAGETTLSNRSLSATLGITLNHCGNILNSLDCRGSLQRLGLSISWLPDGGRCLVKPSLD